MPPKLTEEERRLRGNARRRRWRKNNPKKAKAAGHRAYLKRQAAHPEWNRTNAAQSHLRNPWTKSLQGARLRSRKQNLAFDLDREWAVANYTGFCAMTGLPFVLTRGGGSGPNPFAPSIDKIDPKLGYTPQNCRFVLHAMNLFKHTLTDAALIPIAAAFLAHQARD